MKKDVIEKKFVIAQGKCLKSLIRKDFNCPQKDDKYILHYVGVVVSGLLKKDRKLRVGFVNQTGVFSPRTFNAKLQYTFILAQESIEIRFFAKFIECKGDVYVFEVTGDVTRSQEREAFRLDIEDLKISLDLPGKSHISYTHGYNLSTSGVGIRVNDADIFKRLGSFPLYLSVGGQVIRALGEFRHYHSLPYSKRKEGVPDILVGIALRFDNSDILPWLGAFIRQQEIDNNKKWED